MVNNRDIDWQNEEVLIGSLQIYYRLWLINFEAPVGSYSRKWQATFYKVVNTR